MKFIGCVAVLALLVNLSTQISQFENCSPEFQANYNHSCSTVTCNENGDFSVLICAESRCQPDKAIGYTEPDNSKVYPACCSRPVCDD